MSHIVTLRCKLHDAAAIGAACRRLGLLEPVQGTAELYSGQASGQLVRLPGWEYPVVVDTLTGTVRFDNFEGQWGEQQQLDRFLQAYAVERAKLEATRKGYPFTETTLQDGSIKLAIHEGG